MEKHDLLEKKLKEKGIPYERNRMEFSVALIFHDTLLKYAKEVGLTSGNFDNFKEEEK